MSSVERQQRLFFALWPDDALRASLAPRIERLQAGCDGRPQRPDQWHVTLEFLGSLTAPRVADAVDAAAQVCGAPFEVVFDAVEYWRRPQVLCLLANAMPPGLDGLVSMLRAELVRRHFEPERRPFRAHLTLARKVPRSVAVVPIEPLHWPAADFALVESATDRAGSRYTPLATWPLTG